MTTLDSTKYFSTSSDAAFVDAIQRGDVSRVTAALKAGQDPDVAGLSGIRPIHFVFAAKSADVTRVLLEAGADPNAKAPNGNTPLHYAVQQAIPDFTQLLLQYKADPNLPGEVDQPVLYVALSSPIADVILPMLAKGGANINKMWGGYPPLQASMVQQDWKSAVVLIQLGASLELKTLQGETAPQTFCRLLQRMKPVPAIKREVALVGEVLAPQGLSLSCQQQLAAFR